MKRARKVLHPHEEALRDQLVLAADQKIAMTRELERTALLAHQWRSDAKFWQREAEMRPLARLARWVRRVWA